MISFFVEYLFQLFTIMYHKPDVTTQFTGDFRTIMLVQVAVAEQ